MHQRTAEFVNELRRMIQGGGYSSLEFLPSEREMCLRHGIGRGALRAAFAQLESEDLLRRIQGRGLRILHGAERHPQLRVLLSLCNGAVSAEESSALLRGIVIAANRLNVELVLNFLPPSGDWRPLAAKISERSWDGVLFVEYFPREVIPALRRRGCPYCVVNCETEGVAPAIRVDFRAVGRLAGRELIRHGHRRLGFIGGPHSDFIYREMLAGFKGALAEEDLAPDPALVFHFARYEETRIAELKAALQGLQGQPCAIFAGRDYWAQMLYQLCSFAALRIPEEIAVIGYDGVSWPDAAINGLTTILQPVLQEGETAVRYLVEAARDGACPELTIIPPGELVERRSAGGKMARG